MSISLDRLKEIIPSTSASNVSNGGSEGVSLDRLRTIVTAPPIQTPTSTPQAQTPQKNIFQKAGDFIGNIFKPQTPPETQVPATQLSIAGATKNNLQTANLNLKLDANGNITKDTDLVNKAIGTETLNAGTSPTVWDKIKNFLSKPFTASNDELNARAGVAVAVRNAAATKYDIPADAIDLSQVADNLDAYTKDLGVRTQLNNKEFTELMFTMTMPATLAGALGPVKVASMAAGIGKFALYSTAIDAGISAVTGKSMGEGLKSFLPEDTSQATKDFVDIIDLAGKAFLTHKMGSVEPQVADFLTKQKMVEYKLPTTVTIDAKEVQSLFQTGENISPENAKLLQSLGLSSDAWRVAVQHGIKVDVPVSKVVTITDTPFWAKLKNFVGLPTAEPQVSTDIAGKASQAPAGLLTSGKPSVTPSEPIKPVEMAPTSLPQIFIKDASRYQSASDFADSLPGVSSENSQVGYMDPSKITARDSVDPEFVKTLVSRINAGEELAPAILEKGKEGALQTMDGANRLTAYQEVKKPIPVVYNGKDAVEGLTPVKDIYANAAQKPAKVSQPQSEVTKVEPQSVVPQETVVKTSPELQKATEDSIRNIKTIKDVKSTLGSITKQLDQAVTEAEVMSTVAQEKRAGINTVDVATLKRMYARSKTFREGDIETVRSYSDKSRKLINSVIQNIQEIHPDLSEADALDYALNLPTKADENVKNPTAVELTAKQKNLSKFLDQLQAKQKELKIKEDSELIKEFSRALTVKEKLDKALKVEVPRTQLPIGEGKVKVSTLEARMAADIKNMTEEQIKALGTTTYNEMNLESHRAAAAKYVLENPEDAVKALTGEIEMPKGLNAGLIYTAIINNPDGINYELATKVATNMFTAMGQNLVALRGQNPNSPIKVMQDVYEIREAQFKKQYGGKKPTEVAKKIVEKHLPKVTKPAKATDWQALIEEVRC